MNQSQRRMVEVYIDGEYECTVDVVVEVSAVLDLIHQGAELHQCSVNAPDDAAFYIIGCCPNIRFGCTHCAPRKS